MYIKSEKNEEELKWKWHMNGKMSCKISSSLG